MFTYMYLHIFLAGGCMISKVLWLSELAFVWKHWIFLGCVDGWFSAAFNRFCAVFRMVSILFIVSNFGTSTCLPCCNLFFFLSFFLCFFLSFFLSSLSACISALQSTLFFLYPWKCLHIRKNYTEMWSLRCNLGPHWVPRTGDALLVHLLPLFFVGTVALYRVFFFSFFLDGYCSTVQGMPSLCTCSLSHFCILFSSLKLSTH